MSQVSTTAAQEASQSIRQAVQCLAPKLRQRSLLRFSEAFWPSIWYQPGAAPWSPSPVTVAWDLVAIWLTGVVINGYGTKATLREAAEWFLGNDESGELAEWLSAADVCEVEEALPSRLDAEICLELLPYILDPHGPGSRLSVMRDPTTRAARVRKRAEGVFYTPDDVATYMVKGCLDSLRGGGLPTVYDPACGTGVFLRAALRELSRRHGNEDMSYLALNCLFGTDISAWSLDASAFVLLAELLVRGPDRSTPPVELWSRLRLNLGHMDTLLLDPVSPNGRGEDRSRRVSLSKLFSTMKDEPTVIVGNPPYADLGNPPNVKDLIRPFKTLQVKPLPTAEVYVAFLEQMLRLGNRKQCAGSLVLPLSIASNVGPQFAVARQLIQETPGKWRFAFFDREPQALFGEDVKTRNAILFWSRDASSTDSVLASGPLRKWRGDSRAAMFDGIRFTPINCDIQPGIPKVEGSQQAKAMETLGARLDRLGQAVRKVNRMSLAKALTTGDHVVLVGNTAYNFLNVFLRPPESVLEGKPPLSENPLHAIHCATPEMAFAVYGILSSHLAYWWWHTHGDGFHVLRRFILDFPFGNDVLSDHYRDFLSESGSTLWSAISAHPTISLNRGRASLAYNPIDHTEARRGVDRLLVDVAGLNRDFVEELQRFVERTVSATTVLAADRKTDERSQI